MPPVTWVAVSLCLLMGVVGVYATQCDDNDFWSGGGATLYPEQVTSALCPALNGSPSCCSAANFRTLESQYVAFRTKAQLTVDMLQNGSAQNELDYLLAALQSGTSQTKTALAAVLGVVDDHLFKLSKGIGQCADVLLSYYAGAICAACDPSGSGYIDTQDGIQFMIQSSLAAAIREGCADWETEVGLYLEDLTEPLMELSCLEAGFSGSLCTTHWRKETSTYSDGINSDFTDYVLEALAGIRVNPPLDNALGVLMCPLTGFDLDSESVPSLNTLLECFDGYRAEDPSNDYSNQGYDVTAAALLSDLDQTLYYRTLDIPVSTNTLIVLGIGFAILLSVVIATLITLRVLKKRT
ncbi:hypothetical protein KIPB_000036 [Kipferlia bialata]|uniref:Transmembrane protein n=1 Tax=Kipferlia bialata TaxID=797122 RepID=A0A9K3GE19_9EUKA|nr:hypothetical protein KIPB_000036 [Kipferlia bialata]|eukprot:g36.t1